MGLSLRNGDYVPDGTGGLRRTEGREALLEQVLFRLTARRGTFPFLPELGDLLYHVEGVENYRLLAPAADLAAEDGTLPMLGRVTVTEMEADDDV